MYIKKVTSYYVGTEQRVRRAPFLILMSPQRDSRLKEPVKAVVRMVALRQLSHWMMGVARIGGKSITVSGSYGSDGLIKTVPDEIYDRYGIPLPQWLYDKWATGGGWNSAGSEATDMRKWALENYELLRK